ncbi:hypothetical protein M2324_002497 [Rhodovulum sulfidophilum]|uniref:hypothetical protein n=1 Tax=Rhodovulum sulfidophilum TaxID=35806 RepID=UPI000AEAE5F1|nr:hypothetical protein [Rhodovulum sulfidophilum]MCW2304092.1 hypothetical protein [Rhodovulum sulfidophilum]
MKAPYDLDIRAMPKRVRRQDRAPAERPAPDTTSGTAHDTPPEAPSPEEAVRARFGRPVPAPAPDIVDGTATEILPQPSEDPATISAAARPGGSAQDGPPAAIAPADQTRPVAAFPRSNARGAPNPASGVPPCIALMGEIGAGKTTLAHLLVGRPLMPRTSTATRLPPGRITHGTAPPCREDDRGRTAPVDLADLARLSPADTRLIRLQAEAEILRHCDLIDTPGISDPEIGPDVWEYATGLADGVLWCSHAPEAWRPSEAAIWDMFGPRLGGSSLLLLTRFDRLASERDRERVLRRVRRETAGLFAGVLPIALTEALEAPSGRTANGAEALGHALMRILRGLGGRTGQDAGPMRLDPAWRIADPPDCGPPDCGTHGTVRPRRVRVDASRSRSPRPTGTEPPVTSHTRSERSGPLP